MQSRPGASSWTWLLALFSAASFIETVFFGQMSAFTALHLPKLGVLAGEVPLWTGRIAALASAVGIPFLPFWGALADRYSRQPVIVRSFVAHLLASVVMILSPNVWVFAAGRAITGLALGNSGLMLTTLSDSTPPARIGLAFAVMTSAGPIGAFIGPLIGGPIIDHWGFPILMMVDGLLMVALIFALSLGYKDTYQGTNRGPILSMAWESIRVIARSPLLVMIFLSMVLVFGGWMLAFTYIPIIVAAISHGSSPGQTVGLVIGIGGLAALVVAPIVGSLSDKYGHWQILFIGVVLMIVCWPLPMLTRDLTVFTALWGLVNGISSGVFAVSFTVLAQSTASDIKGRVMAFSYLPVNVGLVIGPALGTWVTQFGLFLIFPVAAIITTAGLVALGFAYRLSQSSPLGPRAAEHAS